jgi:acyl carrier protein
MSTSEIVDNTVDNAVVIKFQVRRLIAEVLWTDADQLDDSVPLVDYGLDSLRGISLITALEHKFMVSLTDDVLVRLHTTGQITQYLAGCRS